MNKGIIATCLLFSLPVVAEEALTNQIYTFAGVHQAWLDHDENDAKGLGYQIGLGYSFHPSWSIELGIQSVMQEDRMDPSSQTYDTSNPFDHGFEATGYNLSVIGKAPLEMGTLYYRAGIGKLDADMSTYSPERDCENGLVYYFFRTTDEGESVLHRCDIESNDITGTFGLGMDWDINQSFFLRTEVARIFGKDGIDVNMLTIGVGYSF